MRLKREKRSVIFVAVIVVLSSVCIASCNLKGSDRIASCTRLQEVLEPIAVVELYHEY